MPELLRGRYEQLEVVGSGGQGRVVKALDHLHDRAVALKVRAVRSEADRSALLSEARILFGLPPSAHLPIVREDFFDGDDYVIVMDWVAGTNLDRILHTEGRPGLPPTLVLGWLADAAAALTHLHNQDPPVFHADIKPANLILTKGGRVAVVDFGASSTVSGPGRRGGTPGFAAPERSTRGESSRAADIYSLAATAFALLTGGPPTGIRPSWEGVDPALVDQLESAIREGLATDPARRPATPGELIERMRAGWASSLPSGVLTFCFTDIVGSTGLWEAQPVVMSQALVLHDKTIATAVERRGGRLIDSMGEGDSTVSVFDSPLAAVVAAIDLTRDLAAVTWPSEVTIRARAALHTGEAEQRDGAYFGLTMNTAARLRGLADGGQVFLSKDTAALVRDHLPPDTDLVDLGPTKLRGRSEREQVFAVSAPGVDAPPPGTECPYPGLIAFGPEDADRYFGRDAVVADLIDRLHGHPFVAVIGASGSGKSSVLRAGVGPRWDAGTDVITPGITPTLDGVDGDTDRLLVVDQFEELFTQVDAPEDRATFVDALLRLHRPVALALRADFYGPCAAYRDLATEIAGHQVLLGPMVPDELRAAIVEPAAGAGLRVDAGLVELLVSEVEGEPGALPLLAHALRATWEERDGRTLTLDAYRATGGVTGAIGSTADHVLAGFDDIDREIAQQALLRLVEPGDGIDDTRRRATLTELRPAGDRGERVDRVVAALAAARLVAIDEGTVQVAHEALIREWPQLRTWLADQRDDLRVQRQVTMAAEAWTTGGREPSELYRGPRLARALEWLDRRPQASEAEEEFLRESAAEEQRVQRAQVRANRRLRRSLVGVAVALVLAMIGGAVAVVRGRQAADSRDRADAARLAAVSRSLVERQPDVGLLLAVEAHRREDSAETRSTLLSAVEAHPLLEGLIYGADSGLEAAAFTPDGRTLATPTSDGSGTILWDTATRRRVATLRNGEDLVLDAAISPDGRTLAAAAGSVGPNGDPVSHLQVWDLRQRRLAHYVESPVLNLTSVAFSADGRTLVTQAGVPFDGPGDLTAVVWDTGTWQPRGEPWRLIDGYPDDDVVFLSRDGKLLTAPDGDGATVWDVATRTPRRHIVVTDDDALSTLALSSDGSTVALGLESGKVRTVDTTTGATLLDVVADRDVAPTSIEFSADDAMLAVANRGGRTQLFDVASGAALGPPLAANAAAVNDVSFTADGRRLATAGLDRTGAIWRLDGNRSIGVAHADHSSVATQVVVSPDGRYVLSGGADGTVAVRDLRSRSAQAVRSARRDGEVYSVELDAAGARVVSGDTAGAVTVASFPGLRAQRTRVFDGAWVWATSFNPATGVVAIAVESHPNEDVGLQDAGFVAFWDPVHDREVAPRIVEPGGSPVALAWSPDGRTLAVATDNNVLRLYRAGSTYTRVGDNLSPEDDAVTSIDIAPDGRTIAAGTPSGTVHQFDITTHRPVGPALPGLGFEVDGVAYSRDGSTLAATTVGLGTSRLWDAATGTPIGDELTPGRAPFTERTFGIDHRYPSQPAFSRDGTTLFTPVVDGSVVTWDLRPGSWVDAACKLAGRDLTQAEWRQHVGEQQYRKTCSR